MLLPIRDPALVVLPFREANRPNLSFLFLHAT